MASLKFTVYCLQFACHWGLCLCVKHTLCEIFSVVVGVLEGEEAE